MNALMEYGLFFAKVLTVGITFLLVLAGVFAIRRRQQSTDTLVITSLNEHYEGLHDDLSAAVLSKKAYKAFCKQEKLARKAREKTAEERPRVYVIDFQGDMFATAVQSLRECVTAVLSMARPEDEVAIRLESPGGAIANYGLAASEVARIRAAHIPLTAMVDRVAASGGYLIAAVANTIVAAPFALIGSIGVVAQLPNFHRLLDKNDVDVELITSGEYKRTLTMFGENTKEGRAKFQAQLDAMHDQFKSHLATYRPQLNIAQVATGDFWLAERAFELRLLDAIMTSDDYLSRAAKTKDLYLVAYQVKPTKFWQRLFKTAIGVWSQETLHAVG